MQTSCYIMFVSVCIIQVTVVFLCFFFLLFFVPLRLCHNNLPHLASIFQTNFFFLGPRPLSFYVIWLIQRYFLYQIDIVLHTSMNHTSWTMMYIHSLHSQYFQYNFCFGSWFQWANLKWCFHHLLSYKSIQFVPHIFTKALLERNWNNKLEKKNLEKSSEVFDWMFGSNHKNFQIQAIRQALTLLFMFMINCYSFMLWLKINPIFFPPG